MVPMNSPEKVNKRELMEYYGYRGTAGGLMYYARLLLGWALEATAKVSPHPGLSVLLHRVRGVRIGRHVYIGPGVVLDSLYPSRVVVEDHVSIGMGTMIFAHSNPTCSAWLKAAYFPRRVRETRIRSGAWVAPGCIVLAGVTIGRNSVVGAGSVVVRDVDEYTVVAGNPARRVRTLPQAHGDGSEEQGVG